MTDSLTTEVVVSWAFDPVFDASHRAALSGGKSLVYVCPPAWWTARPLLDRLAAPEGPEVHTVIVAPEPMIPEGAGALLGTAGAGAVHAVTGLARAVRRLRARNVDTLLASPDSLLALVARPGTPLGCPTSLVLAWPEHVLAADGAGHLETLLAEFRPARRLVLVADHTPLEDFLARHAHRAPVCRAAPPPEEAAVEAVRYAVTQHHNLPTAVRAALDTLDPPSAFVWTPAEPGHDWSELGADPSVSVGTDPGDRAPDLTIATDLPSAAVLEALHAVSGEVLLLLRPWQVEYASRLVRRLRAFPLSTEADRARDRGSRLRDEVRRRLAGGVATAELLALAPIFAEHDPAVVAAALVASRPEADTTPEEPSGIPTWVRIHVSAGRRQGVRTGDLVGALLNAVGVSRSEVGKVELRDAFSLVEVRAEVAERALTGLDGLVLRGKTVAARIDRR